jgi:hypothetical protein
MNVVEINPQGGTAITHLYQYIALTLPVTIVTAWIIIAFRSKHIFPKGTSLYKRLGWPIFIIDAILRKCVIGNLKFRDQPLDADNGPTLLSFDNGGCDGDDDFLVTPVHGCIFFSFFLLRGLPVFLSLQGLPHHSTADDLYIAFVSLLIS